ncbi:hypothetical protein KDA00_03250 [Candidatus Saccharibacteria bacterium]|nr:hypothetical protein [Candidatus Saccharibacteria bacterium]
MKSTKFSPAQMLFQEIVIGSLIYATVLGFLNDYTSIVYAKSFSTIFFASIVLEFLTYLAFQLKGRIIKWLKDYEGFAYRVVMFLCIWFVMFASKFAFIWALDLVFGSYININGFFGILIVVICVTVIHRLAYKVFTLLGQPEK